MENNEQFKPTKEEEAHFYFCYAISSLCNDYYQMWINHSDYMGDGLIHIVRAVIKDSGTELNDFNKNYDPDSNSILGSVSFAAKIFREQFKTEDMKIKGKWYYEILISILEEINRINTKNIQAEYLQCGDSYFSDFLNYLSKKLKSLNLTIATEVVYKLMAIASFDFENPFNHQHKYTAEEGVDNTLNTLKHNDNFNYLIRLLVI